MRSKYDIAIAGGGIVGLISAIILRRSRAFSESDIYIIEKNEKRRFSAHNDIGFRVSAISAGSIQILKKINIASISIFLFNFGFFVVACSYNFFNFNNDGLLYPYIFLK